MNNSNFEFKSYIPTPDDQYMLGTAKVRLFGKLTVYFKHVKTKDGSGTFFCAPTIQTKDAMGEKKYLPAFQLSDRDDEEKLDEVIRMGVNAVLTQRGRNQFAEPQPNLQYPHGLVQPSKPATTGTQTTEMNYLASGSQMTFNGSGLAGSTQPSSMDQVPIQADCPF